MRAVTASLSQTTAVLSGFISGQITNICIALVDKMQRPVIELLKITRGIAHISVPLIPQPAHILLDCVDKNLTFLFGVGVIKTQVTFSTKLFRQLKIHCYRFCMTQMQKSVGLRREPGNQSAGPTCVKIGLNLGLKEIASGFGTHGWPLNRRRMIPRPSGDRRGFGRFGLSYVKNSSSPNITPIQRREIWGRNVSHPSPKPCSMRAFDHRARRHHV